MSETTTLVRRQLGARLKRLREKAGKTLADVEAASGVGSPSKLWRIESGRSSVRTGDVRELCALYGAPNHVLDPLLALARATKTDGWSEDYTSVLWTGVGLYASLEADADAIKTYDAELIHGLIRTPEYHRAVTSAELLVAGPTSRRLEPPQPVPAERRATVFDRASPCRFTAVLGEAALLRQIGSAEVMAAQLKHLRDLNDRDEVELRVLTLAAGAHAGLRGGAFTLLDFDDPEDPDVVYLESQTAARYLEQPVQLEAYGAVWADLYERSVPLRRLPLRSP
jgi:transcriptional regulator with XRE-family HTH domain